MKNIFGLALLIFSMNVIAVKAPSQEIVDQYISVALKNDVTTLQGKKSKWSCTFSIMHEKEGFIGHGKTVDEAIQRLQLVCIKSQCQKVGQWADEGQVRLDAMSDQEYRDLLEFLGKSPEEIEIAVQTRGIKISTEGMTCENSGPQYRTLAFDSCFSVPVSCGKSGWL